MAWFRVDDGADFHQKIVAAGNESWGALCRAGAWASRHKTDGFIPDSIANLIASAKVWRRGCDAGLLERDTRGGWQIHDFLQWNPSADEVETARLALSEKRRKAGLAGNAKRWDGHRKPVANESQLRPDCDGTCEGHDLAPVPSRPVPDLSEGSEPASQPPPTPILTNPEPSPESRKRKVNGKPAKVLPPKPNPTGDAMSNWRSAWSAAYKGRTYSDAAGDFKLMGQLVKQATELGERCPSGPLPASEVLAHWFDRYLDDGAVYLADACHPLRCLPRDLPKYGAPWDEPIPDPDAHMWPPPTPKSARIYHDDEHDESCVGVPPPPEFTAAIAQLAASMKGNA